MKILDRILHRQTEAVTPEAEAADAPSSGCPHVALVPAWDGPADIGIEAKASSFSCGACGATFTPEEARELRATEAERIRFGNN
jgi:hypothetical protein